MKRIISPFLLFFILSSHAFSQNNIVVFQTDFGLKDGAVSAMKGVAMNVSTDLKLFDLTHEIPAYNIWEAAYRLEQTVKYWPAGTVFVSVVDPGVGTARRSVVLKTKSGHFIVTPDNGTLTLIAKSLGIEAVREIDEAINRRKDSKESYTFHGRDVYAYTAARLASGVITYDQVGSLLKPEVVSFSYQEPVHKGKIFKGNIPMLDVQYGNVWTNISIDMMKSENVKYGDVLHFIFYKNKQQVCKIDAPYVATFGGVAEGKPLCYFNSLMQLSIALNMGDFAAKYHIGSGPEWSVEVQQ